MSVSDETSLPPGDLMRLCADIVGAYVGRNPVAPTAVNGVIGEVYRALERLGKSASPAGPPPRLRPAIPIARSVQHDFIVCLEDGKKLKMLKRYLKSRFDLTPEEYRRRWGLPAEYPMVAPAYAERRSAFAKQIGLGRGVRRRAS